MAIFGIILLLISLIGLYFLFKLLFTVGFFGEKINLPRHKKRSWE